MIEQGTSWEVLFDAIELHKAGRSNAAKALLELLSPSFRVSLLRYLCDACADETAQSFGDDLEEITMDTPHGMVTVSREPQEFAIALPDLIGLVPEILHGGAAA